MGKFNSGASTNLIHIISDFGFGLLSFFIIVIINSSKVQANFQDYFLSCIMFMLIYFLANKEARVYNVTTFFYTDRVLRKVTKSFLIATSITSTLLFYVSEADIDRMFYVEFLICIYVLLIISAFVVRLIMKNHKFAPRVVLIGDIDRFKKFEHFLERSNMDVNVVGYVSMSAEYDERYLGTIYHLDNIIHDHVIDQVFFMHRNDDPVDVQPYIDMCMDMGVTIRIIMNAYKAGTAQSYVSSCGTYPIVTYHTVSLNKTSRAVKRVIDIIGSIVALIIFSPFMLLTAIAVKLDSKGPVLFKQTRVGLNGRHFTMYKFRSMCVNADSMKEELMKENELGEDGLMFKMKDDPRITKVGKFIRKTSLDEFPQFFNVLKGDMSLVGTRPPTLDEVARYSRSHWRRMSIKPGITGMWQVSGRSTINDFDLIVELDTQYIDKWSIFLDFKIMLQTVFCMLRRKGAY